MARVLLVEAWSGDDAVNLLNGSDTFDVLFTDVRIPGALDGVDVAIHARGRYPALPVLVVSGYAAHLMARLSVLDPAAHFISKPYSLAEVVDKLNQLVEAA